MNDDNLDYILVSARNNFDVAEDASNPNNNFHFRSAAFDIVNYYNVVLLNLGAKLDLSIEEAYNLDKKFFIAAITLPELLDEFSPLVKKVESIRNCVSHTDVSIPDKRKLRQVITSAEEFNKSVKKLAEEKIREKSKRKSLKEQYDEKKDFIRRLLKSTLPDFKEVALKSNKFKKVFENLKYFESINVNRLDNSSIKSLIAILENTLDDAEEVYEYIHSHCPECGGKLTSRTENKPLHNKGDYEPYGYQIEQIIECSECGKEVDRDFTETYMI